CFIFEDLPGHRCAARCHEMAGRDRSNYDRQSVCSPPLLYHHSHAGHRRRSFNNAYLSLTELVRQPAESLATILFDFYSSESAIDPIVTLHSCNAILENIHMGLRGGKALSIFGYALQVLVLWFPVVP